MRCADARTTTEIEGPHDLNPSFLFSRNQGPTSTAHAGSCGALPILGGGLD